MSFHLKHLRIAFVMGPLVEVNPAKDTSFAMMLSAQAGGASVFHIDQRHLYLSRQGPRARAFEVSLVDEAQNFATIVQETDEDLRSFDLILMRTDPPVDEAYITATQILRYATFPSRPRGFQKDGEASASAGSPDKRKTLVWNAPTALQRHNEKLFTLEFPDFVPDTLVTADKDKIKEFAAQHGSIIIKPLNLFGGQGIFQTGHNDINFESICDMLMAEGKTPVVAQPFLKAIQEGDRRVLVIHGRPYPFCLCRLPQKGSIRANLAAGGSYKVQELSSREREIAETVGDHLVKEGVVFAGLDIIGGYLTEINITSPTCARQISQATGEDVTGLLFAPLSRE